MKTFRGRAVLTAGICLFGIFPVHSADADSSATDKAIATELFKEGRALLEQGRVGPACRKLEESQRLDPGGGTLLNVAVCHEREGRTASAWVEFTEALGIAKRDERPQRIDFARTHLAQLEPLLSRLIIEVPSSVDVPDLEIRRDGSLVGRAAWGSPVPVDPGDHVVEASAPGKLSWRQVVTVRSKADTKNVVIASLEDAPAQAPAGTPSVEAPKTPAIVQRTTQVAAAPSPARPAPDRQSVAASAGTAGIVAWVALGVGAAGAAVGTYFGFRAVSLKNDADHNCPKDVCSAQGASQNRDAIRSGDFSTAGFSVAALGVGLATFLFVTQSVSRDATPTASPAVLNPKITAGGLAVGSDRNELILSGRW